MARISEWDVLLCWEFSRLARSSEDLGWIRNRLHVMKKTAFEAATGLDVFNVGSKVMGVLAEEYLVKLRADTRRGLRGERSGGLPQAVRRTATARKRSRAAESTLTDAASRPGIAS